MKSLQEQPNSTFETDAIAGVAPLRQLAAQLGR